MGSAIGGAFQGQLLRTSESTILNQTRFHPTIATACHAKVNVCAGYFVYAQIADIPDIRWLHIDLGDPVGNFGLSGRATAYGVGLLSTLATVCANEDESASGLMPKL